MGEPDYDEKLTILLIRIGINNFKILDVIVRIGAEGQFHTEGFFHADEQFRILGAEAL